MKTNPVVWFEIYVQDMERAKTFYEGVLQGKLERIPGPDIMEGCPSGGSSTLVYFKCKDCAVEAARAGEHGGRLFKEKMSIGQYGFIALVLDTEGNMIGLHSMQ